VREKLSAQGGSAFEVLRLNYYGNIQGDAARFEYQDSLRELDRLVDVVCHEQHGGAVTG